MARKKRVETEVDPTSAVVPEYAQSIYVYNDGGSGVVFTDMDDVPEGLHVAQYELETTGQVVSEKSFKEAK